MGHAKTAGMLLLASASAVLLSACDSKEQKALNAAWEAQGAQNAVSYIQQKYGFQADVLSAQIDRRHGAYNPQPLSDCVVRMQHDGCDFTVYISGEGETDIGRDTYQSAEIEQAAYDKISADFPGLHTLELVPASDSSRLYEMKEPFYAVCYDGSNLTETLADGITGFRAYYPQTDLSDETAFAALKQFSEDAEICAELYACTDAAFSAAESGQGIPPHDLPVFCSQFRRLTVNRTRSSPKEREPVFRDYQVQQLGDLFYCVTKDPDWQYGEPVDSLPLITEITPPDPAVFDGYGAKGAQIASKAYTISADSFMWVHIFCPVSQIKPSDTAHVQHSQLRFGMIPAGTASDGIPSADPVSVRDGYCCQSVSVRQGLSQTVVFLYQP